MTIFEYDEEEHMRLEREEIWKRKKKNKCSNRNEHKLPPANANGIKHSETQTPGPKLRKPYGRGGMPVSAGLCKRHQPF